MNLIELLDYITGWYTVIVVVGLIMLAIIDPHRYDKLPKK
jgi:hypothetical protein